MAKQLYAKVNDLPEEVVLERKTPFEPWRLQKMEAQDIVRTGEAEFSVLLDGRSHRVLVQKEDAGQQTFRMRIGGRSYTVRLQDDQARLLKTLGMEKSARKVSELKAPMPGMVLNILVQPGEEVKKDQPLLVLEAMKMENVIKSPGDGVVKAIVAQQGKAVEKGQLLISFA